MHKAKNRTDFFTRFTSTVAATLGRAWVFVLALCLLIGWAAAGPFWGFSDRWQLLVNTGTTIITFLVVFIIQNTTSRGSLALNIKLDAIMHKLGIAEDILIKAEDMNEKNLAEQLRLLQRRANGNH